MFFSVSHMICPWSGHEDIQSTVNAGVPTHTLGEFFWLAEWMITHERSVLQSSCLTRLWHYYYTTLWQSGVTDLTLGSQLAEQIGTVPSSYAAKNRCNIFLITMDQMTMCNVKGVPNSCKPKENYHLTLQFPLASFSPLFWFSSPLLVLFIRTIQGSGLSGVFYCIF